MTKRIPLALALVAVIGAASPVRAADGDPQAGRIVAQRECGACHAVGTTGDSTLPDAPTFRALRGRITTPMFAQMLRDRMEVGHPRMPRLHLDLDELAHLMAYWESLPGPQQAALEPSGAPRIAR